MIDPKNRTIDKTSKSACKEMGAAAEETRHLAKNSCLMARPSITIPSFANLPASTAKRLSITLRRFPAWNNPTRPRAARRLDWAEELVTIVEKVGNQPRGDQRLTLRPSCYMVPILKAPRGEQKNQRRQAFEPLLVQGCGN
jgi:hypothetical protein